MFDIKDYRQPMVTSIGIIMGFLLNFIATWVIEEGEQGIISLHDKIVISGLFIALIGMLFTMYRLFKPLPNGVTGSSEASKAYYTVTFRFYCASIFIAIVGLLVALFY